MRLVLRRSMAATAAIAVAVLVALGSASPAVADGGKGHGGGGHGGGGDWYQDQDFRCNSFELGSLCLNFAVIGGN